MQHLKQNLKEALMEQATTYQDKCQRLLERSISLLKALETHHTLMLVEIAKQSDNGNKEAKIDALNAAYQELKDEHVHN